MKLRFGKRMALWRLDHGRARQELQESVFYASLVTSRYEIQLNQRYASLLGSLPWRKKGSSSRIFSIWLAE